MHVRAILNSPYQLRMHEPMQHNIMLNNVKHNNNIIDVGRSKKGEYIGGFQSKSR